MDGFRSKKRQFFESRGQGLDLGSRSSWDTKPQIQQFQGVSSQRQKNPTWRDQTHWPTHFHRLSGLLVPSKLVPVQLIELPQMAGLCVANLIIPLWSSREKHEKNSSFLVECPFERLERLSMARNFEQLNSWSYGCEHLNVGLPRQIGAILGTCNRIWGCLKIWNPLSRHGLSSFSKILDKWPYIEDHFPILAWPPNLAMENPALFEIARNFSTVFPP